LISREREKGGENELVFFFVSFAFSGLGQRREKTNLKVEKSQTKQKRSLTCQVRDRVRDVVVGHRQDRELRDRAGAALDAPCALVDGREVGVPVL
jgi:hypothetical protein